MLRDTISHRTPRMTWPWGEHRRIRTVQTLYFVWAQLIHGFADQHRSGCLVYVSGVDVRVEQGEQAHHNVGYDQPTQALSHPRIQSISPPVVSDEWSV